MSKLSDKCVKSPKPKDLSFTATENTEKLQIVTFQKLEMTRTVNGIIQETNLAITLLLDVNSTLNMVIVKRIDCGIR